MSKMDELSADHLRIALDEAEDAKVAKRLMVALAYKDGVDINTISKRYGILQSTIYYGLDRFENRPIADALQDESRPGRPSKLSAEQRAKVETWLENSPQKYKEDAEMWTVELLRDRINDVFDVEYSEAHIRRLFLT